MTYLKKLTTINSVANIQAYLNLFDYLYFQILEAEKEKLKHELQHQEAAITYTELEQRAVHLEKQLKKNINKAR